VAPALLTFGHGTASQDEIVGLLRGAGVARLVDVRRYPGSRAHPHVARDAMAQWLPEAGVGYRSEPRLGGRRRLPPDSPDVWWEVAAFRAYAAHMRTPEFLSAADDLLADAATTPTAVMCSETVWWRCHRRLIADFVTLARGGEVLHLGHDGRLSGHPPAAGARVVDGLLVYDVGSAPRS
jgi:uncharacterized protein (DUF488 family)